MDARGLEFEFEFWFRSGIVELGSLNCILNG